MATGKRENTNLVQWGDYTTEEAAQQEKESREQRMGGSMITLKQGKTRIRILPPRKGEKLVKVAYQHAVDVPGVGTVFFNCPRLMAKRACKTCAAQARLEASTNELDVTKGKKLKPKRQCYVNAIDRADEDPQPRPFRFGPMIEDQLTELRQDEEDGGNFTHPVEGFDLNISRKGEKMNTRYKVTKGRVCPLHEDATVMNDWIATQSDLRNFLKVLSDEEIEAKLNGENVRDDDDAPRARSRRNVSDAVDAIDVPEDDFEVEDED